MKPKTKESILEINEYSKKLQKSQAGEQGATGDSTKQQWLPQWETAKQGLISSWRENLKGLQATSSHSAFLDNSHVGIQLDPAPTAGKFCTFDSRKPAVIIYEEYYRVAWMTLRKDGIEPGSATSLLAKRSLAGFAHCVRDGMMKLERRSLGLDFPVGVFEDEVFHWWEAAEIQAQVDGLFPDLYPRRGGWEAQSDPFALQAEELRGIRGSGSDIASLVVGRYDGMASILVMSRERVMNHYTRLYNTQQKEGGLNPGDDLLLKELTAFLADENKYNRFKNHIQVQLTKINVTRVNLCSADRRLYGPPVEIMLKFPDRACGRWPECCRIPDQPPP